GLAFSLVHLCKSSLDHIAVIGAAVVEKFRKAESGVTQQDLGILETLVVVGHAEMELFGHVLDLLEEIGGLVGLAGCVLLHAELRHLMNEFGIKESLFAGLDRGNASL